MNSRRARSGFALLAVLWVIVGLTTLALASSLVARNAIAAARNRTELARARWRATDCVERARAAMGALLRSPAQGDTPVWSTMDAGISVSPLLTSARCDVRMRAVGTRIDVNHADGEMLTALLRRLGVDSLRRDSMVDALLDWRDADDVPRPRGAERDWYASRGRGAPRNGPLADIHELLSVRGFESLQGLDSVLDIEPGRISLARAPLAVIAALPGVDEEVLLRIAEQRRHNTRIEDVLGLASTLSPAARAQLLTRYADLVHSATTDPDAWILESRATVGAPAVSAVIEVRLVRSGNRAAVVRKRMWIP
jgi:general secretion pathway protein K